MSRRLAIEDHEYGKFKDNGFGEKVVGTKIDGARGYLAFDSIIREIISGVTFDTVTSSINGGTTEVLSFSEAGTVVREVQISYTSTGWTIYKYTGAVLDEDGFFVLDEDGFKILLEG